MLLPAAVALALSTAPDTIDTLGDPTAPAPPPPAFAAAAAPPAQVVKPAPAPGDPLEGLNRRAFHFNDSFDRKIFGPTARYYKHKAPGGFQRALHNFVTNFGEPVVFANDALQIRPKRAMTTAFRFVVNTTVGVAGVFDVAKRAGAEHHDNDFGITLGRYGCPPGPYLYVPLLGPSSVRDALGKAVDGLVIDPLNWAGFVKELEPAHPPRHPHPYYHHTDSIPHRDLIRAGEAFLSALDTRARVDEDLSAMMGAATDPYATMRSVYLQNRAALVSQAHWRHSDVPDFETPADMPPPAGETPRPSTETPPAPPETSPPPPPPAPGGEAAPAAPGPSAASGPQPVAVSLEPLKFIALGPAF